MAEITWYGHAAFKIQIADKIVLIDPYLNKNPASPVKAEDVGKADIVFVTHDHGDHLGDAFSICEKTNAAFVAASELAGFAEQKGVRNVVDMNIGGTVEIKGVKLTVVQAVHTTAIGDSTGVIVRGEGKTLYHAGDTGLFEDMRLIGEAPHY